MGHKEWTLEGLVLKGVMLFNAVVGGRRALKVHLDYEISQVFTRRNDAEAGLHALILI